MGNREKKWKARGREKIKGIRRKPETGWKREWEIMKKGERERKKDG